MPRRPDREDALRMQLVALLEAALDTAIAAPRTAAGVKRQLTRIDRAARQVQAIVAELSRRPAPGRRRTRS